MLQTCPYQALRTKEYIIEHQFPLQPADVNSSPVTSFSNSFIPSGGTPPSAHHPSIAFTAPSLLYHPSILPSSLTIPPPHPTGIALKLVHGSWHLILPEDVERWVRAAVHVVVDPVDPFPVKHKPRMEQRKLDLPNEVELVHHILLNVLHQQYVPLEVVGVVLWHNHGRGPRNGIIQPRH